MIINILLINIVLALCSIVGLCVAFMQAWQLFKGEILAAKITAVVCLLALVGLLALSVLNITELTNLI